MLTLKELYRKCEDYESGLSAVDKSVEKILNTGLKYTSISDLMIKKAQLLIIKAKKEGDRTLYSEANELVSSAIQWAEDSFLKGKLMNFFMEAGAIWKETGNSLALQSKKSQIFGLIEELSTQNTKFQYDKNMVKELFDW